MDKLYTESVESFAYLESEIWKMTELDIRRRIQLAIAAI